MLPTVKGRYKCVLRLARFLRAYAQYAHRNETIIPLKAQQMTKIPAGKCCVSVTMGLISLIWTLMILRGMTERLL